MTLRRSALVLAFLLAAHLAALACGGTGAITETSTGAGGSAEAGGGSGGAAPADGGKQPPPDPSSAVEAGTGHLPGYDGG